MPSTATKLDHRVTVLELELRKLRSELKSMRNAARRRWWEQLAGRFKNEPLFDTISPPQVSNVGNAPVMNWNFAAELKRAEVE